MQYMGGKFRQSKAICQVLKPYINENTVYVEPFCGGMWSAARVAKELHPSTMILNDVNKPLMLLWEKCLAEGCDWLPKYPTFEEYNKYKQEQPEDDPLTAYYGFGFSFGGAYYTSYIKPGTSHNGDQVKSIEKKVKPLSRINIDLHVGSYKDLVIPDNAVVYLDPPYEGRTKAHHFDSFNYDEFWGYARKLSKRCIVFTSCFDCPSDFETVYSWGDTVHRYTDGKRNTEYTDGTNERLVKYNEAD